MDRPIATMSRDDMVCLLSCLMVVCGIVVNGEENWRGSINIYGQVYDFKRSKKNQTNLLAEGTSGMVFQNNANRHNLFTRSHPL
jgi:hypothetical protein